MNSLLSLLSICALMFVRTASAFRIASLGRSSTARASLSSLTRHYSASTRKPQKNNIQVPTWVPDAPEEDGTYSRPVIQWYPGHIAKAERLLKETFQAVDVIVEVRDSRAPKATSHPKVGEWCSGRPRLVVFTHVDAVPSATHRAWKQYHEEQALESGDDDAPQQFLWVNAKQGQGIPALHRAIFKAGSYVQERRQRRGLKERPLRVGLMGYPNVGKSALINRLLGRRRAKTANTPGVTRSLQWIRVRTDDTKKTGKKEYELLDSPGIIPASLEDQSDALLLAACHCIGEASYDNQVVAAYLCQWMLNMLLQGQADTAAPQYRESCRIRWGVDPLKPVPIITDPLRPGAENDNNEESGSRYVTGEEMVYMVADNVCKGNPEEAARKILQDFRSGRMGSICLQVAPTNNDQISSDGGAITDFSQVPDPRMGTVRAEGVQGASNDWELHREQQQALQRERIQVAKETAKERGIELPPAIVNKDADKKENKGSSQDEVGKGLFDGW